MLETGGTHGEPIHDALSWFDAGTAPSGPMFRILFAAADLSRLCPRALVAGMCLRFSFAPASSSEPFARCDHLRLGEEFRRTAVDAEIRAHELCGKDFGRRKHRRIRIEDGPETLAILDGSSGYLSLLLAHLCVLRGIDLSPYVGFTGSHHAFRKLSGVSNLAQKMQTAIQGGMRFLFVPRVSLGSLDGSSLPPAELLELVPYDESRGLAEAMEEIIGQLQRIVGDISPDSQPSLAASPSDGAKSGGTTSPLSRRALGPVPLQEPVKLFNGLRTLAECGGFATATHPPRLSIFTPSDDSFVSLFPGRRRLYRFDTFGRLCEKRSSQAIPLAALWDEESEEYVIGFADGHIQRYDARLEPTSGFQLPGGLEPRCLACTGDTLFVADRRRPHVVAMSRQGNIIMSRSLTGRVCDLDFSEKRGQLVVGLERAVSVLTPALAVCWQADHDAPHTGVSCSSSGEVWVGLSTGRIWKYPAGHGQQRTVDVGAAPGLRSLAVLEDGLIAATLRGQITLYDADGSPLGTDELGTPLYHVCATEGGLLVLSTARGVTVVRPDPGAIAAARDWKLRDAGSKLSSWENAIGDPRFLNRLVRAFLQRLDLGRWEEVIAFQSTFLRRKEQDPARYKRIEETMWAADAKKSAVLCVRTTPAIIDGSNVSRHHWNNDDRSNRRSRLGSIIKVRDALARETNPVLYPVVIVVDVTERHTSDNPGELKRMIGQGEILETPSKREADALIFNLITTHDWSDCQIVTNDFRMFDAHAHNLPGRDVNWYRRVQRAFTINQRSGEAYFPGKSR